MGSRLSNGPRRGTASAKSTEERAGKPQPESPGLARMSANLAAPLPASGSLEVAFFPPFWC